MSLAPTPLSTSQLRNVAIIAHVDHGKTTLVDQLLYQSGQFRNADLAKLAGGQHGLIFDSNELERERGITIFSKNCAVRYHSAAGEQYRINLIDTPGHADFGGEVERVLGMASGTILMVDAFEGPMPQTRFVLEKSLEHGLRPIVVVNKIDRPDARPLAVVDEVFDLLVDLDAADEVLEFPTVFASAKEGWATLDLDEPSENLQPLFETILQYVPAPELGRDDNLLRVQITTLDYSDYVGRIAIGRIHDGVVTKRQRVAVFDRDGHRSERQIGQVLAFDGLGTDRNRRHGLRSRMHPTAPGSNHRSTNIAHDLPRERRTVFRASRQVCDQPANLRAVAERTPLERRVAGRAGRNPGAISR